MLSPYPCAPSLFAVALMLAALVSTMKVSPLYNFLIVLVCHAVLLWTVLDPCRTQAGNRLDCGYSGIEAATCVTTGKFQLMMRNKSLLIKNLIFYAFIFYPTMSVYRFSGFPSATSMLYAGLAAFTCYSSTRCCYDNETPDSPHCFY